MANLYKIEELLIGKTYRSKSLTGEIVSAEKDNRAVWYGENNESYLVQIKSPYSINYKWRTIAVKVGD
jgi:hypothetical protein